MEKLPDLDPGDARPVHQQISARLREAIETGVLVPGDRVPGENTLMGHYGVSRWVAREALATLASGGLIEKVPKVGTFVKNTHRLRRRSRSRYGRARADQQLLTSRLQHEIMFAGRAPVPQHVADASGIEPSEMVVRRRILRDKDTGRIEEIGASYIPVGIAGGTYLEDPEVVPKALFLCVEDLSGKQYTRAQDLWISRPPNASEVETLGLATGNQVIHVIHTAWAGDDTVLEVSESVWPADRIVFVDEYHIPQEPDTLGGPSDI